MNLQIGISGFWNLSCEIIVIILHCRMGAEREMGTMEIFLPSLIGSRPRIPL